MKKNKIDHLDGGNVKKEPVEQNNSLNTHLYSKEEK